MKLAFGLLGAAAAITCPNEAWRTTTTVDADGVSTDACVVGSDDYPVTVTCEATSMTIQFNSRHIYKDLAIPSDNYGVIGGIAIDGCIEMVNDGDGNIEMTIPLDDCGTTVSQADGNLIFGNSITGDEELIKQTIGTTTVFTTQLLEFDVECMYTDTDTVSVDSIEVEAMDVTGEADSSGSFGFAMEAFVNDEAITELNPLVLGESVEFGITPSQVLPSNIQYFVTRCSASGTDDNGDAQSFDVITNGRCTAAALDTDIVDLQSTANNVYTWAMNGFSFSSDGGAVIMSCDIQLCAIDSDGFVSQDCHNTAEANECQTDLGYVFDDSI